MKKTSVKIIAILAAIMLVLTACGGKIGSETVTDGGSDAQNSQGDLTGMPSEPGSETETVTEISAPAYSVSDNLIAITFDDGPGNDSSSKILDILAANNAVATFFVVGYALDEHPEITKRAFDEGSEIANHTKDHKYLSKSSVTEIHEQIDYVNNKVEEITGTRPVLLRAPGGNFKGATGEVGMPLIQWSIDTNDWRHKDKSGSSRTEEQRNSEINDIVDMVMRDVGPGDIILMHEIYNFTADVCEILIPKLAQAGYKMVTVSQLFEAYGTKLEPGNVYYKASSESAAEANDITVEPGNYVISTAYSSLNLRQDATASSGVLTEIPKDTVVTVTESVAGWAKTTYNGHTGWISTKYIKPAVNS